MARGKGIYKRGTVWWIRYAAPDGTIRRESSKSKNFTVAEAKLTARRKDVQEGRDPTPINQIRNITFAELAEQYLPLMAEQKAAQIVNVMKEARLFPPAPEFSAKARIKSMDEYEKMWKEAAADIPGFWGKMAGELHWFKKFDKQ